MRRKDLGIYIHIPFCVRKCLYCDFCSMPAEDDIKYNYVNKLMEEISVAERKYNVNLSQFQVRTIYIGGGTPSVIHEDYINIILCKVKEYFSKQKQEITIEVNPGTVTRKKLVSYKEAGI
ncbi:MAG: radical SAM protein, partial [Lachnospiraceae bacterium]|nr:radical SAM protein [Lachnospiraceae bacterium]